MMVNAYPNDIDDARSRRQIPLAHLPSFSHPLAGIYPRRRVFQPSSEASEPSMSPDSDSSHPLQQTLKVSLPGA